MHHKERCILKHNICNFVGLLTIGTLVFGAVPGLAAAPSNPRGVSGDVNARAKTSDDSGVIQRSATPNVTTRGNAARSGIAGRVSARGAVTSNVARSGAIVIRSNTPAATVLRSASARNESVPANTNRSATSNGVSRSALSRATAIFNDVSKIGGGYASCRDAYATCMDQFCANANDTYRRCFCSSRFTEFRDTEDALNQAKELLMQFEDNNLNAVDKSAAEVEDMYSATVGEAAIKKDTSGAAKILDQIGDLLSGKKSSTKNINASLGLITVDTISGDIDDIWGNNNSGSVFSTSGSGVNLADLEGESLYNASNQQCVSMMADNCSSDAVLQMARSSYSIMITQDCNTYEKKIDKQKESVKQTVRTAEKYLREARLEEYRNHNSADVNECMARVKTALTADTACGENYKRCLDGETGVYINPTTGDAIYTPRLYNLTSLINLSGNINDSDILLQNPSFNSFLDSKRNRAATALDTCRAIADTVWTEFKRSALIEIAQAQDEKIEEVKMSCISTIKQCYDDKTSQLNDFDDTTAKAAGATGAYAAKAMCAEKVAACAALYGNGAEQCNIENGVIKNAISCGLSALMSFVDSVDNSRIADACETSIKSYVTKLCTPDIGSASYPYKCRDVEFGSEGEYDTPDNSTTLYALVGRYATANCGSDDSVKSNVKGQIKSYIEEARSELASMMENLCTKTYSGVWTGDYDNATTISAGINDADLNTNFYTIVFAGNKTNKAKIGWCKENNKKAQCEAQDALTGGNGYVTYNATLDDCVFAEGWYENRCRLIGGVWDSDDGACYVADTND